MGLLGREGIGADRPGWDTRGGNGGGDGDGIQLVFSLKALLPPE